MSRRCGDALVCCVKKGRYQRTFGKTLVPPKDYTQLSRSSDWVVVAGAPRRSHALVLPPFMTGLLSSDFSRRRDYSLIPAMLFAFTTTERALLGQDTLRSHLQACQRLVYRLHSALSCYALVFSEVSHLIAALVEHFRAYLTCTFRLPAGAQCKGTSGPLRSMCHTPYCINSVTDLAFVSGLPGKLGIQAIFTAFYGQLTLFSESHRFHIWDLNFP